MALGLLPRPAIAADICEAVAIRDVPVGESPDSVIKKVQKDGAITTYKVDKKTGVASFCSHGGYRYPADGLKLLNCKVGTKQIYADADEIGYSVDVVRVQGPRCPAALR